MTIAIPSFDRADQLSRCLEAVLDQVSDADRVVVVLRPDDVRGREVARRHCVDVLDVHEPGHLPPVVRALQDCHTETIAFVDDDAVPQRAWLLRLRANFRDEQVVGLGGPVIDHPPVPRTVRVRRASVRRAVRHRGRSWYGAFKGLPLSDDLVRRGIASPFPIDHVTGASMAFRTSALRRYGIDLGLNRGAAVCYESDLCLGLKPQGVVLFDPAFIADHYPGPRRGAPGRNDAKRYAMDYAYNLGRIAGKHFSTAELCLFRLYMDFFGQSACPGLVRVLRRGSRGERTGPGLATALRRQREVGIRDGRNARSAR